MTETKKDTRAMNLGRWTRVFNTSPNKLKPVDNHMGVTSETIRKLFEGKKTT